MRRDASSSVRPVIMNRAATGATYYHLCYTLLHFCYTLRDLADVINMAADLRRVQDCYT